MFTFTTIGLSVSPRRITDSCMGIPSGKSCWPAQSYENRTGIEHKGGKWVFSELKNEPVLSHFYCITSCLLAHCPFGRFFLASFPLYSGGNDATLAHPR